MDSVPTWDEYFIEIAKTVSIRSKDPSTKVGCVLVDHINRIVGTGYNGMIAGIKETAEMWQRPYKYDHVVHAEINAINHLVCDKSEPLTCYTTVFPCNKCMTQILQTNITKIVYIKDYIDTKESMERFLSNGKTEIKRI